MSNVANTKKDRIFIDNKYREFLDTMKANDWLGFGLTENKDIFTTVAALGINNPKDFTSSRFGFALLSYVKARDKALYEAMLLGLAENDEQIDEYADLNMSIEYCQKCANGGLDLLQNKFMEAAGDKELFTRRLLKELDLLFLQNVDS